MKIARLLVFCFMLFVITASGSFVSAADDNEEITLTTYYPAPYGEYDMLSANRLVAVPYALPSADPSLGEIFFADGSDASYDKGLYIYLGNKWEQLGFSGQDDVWIGGVSMGSGLKEIWSTLSPWFDPAYGFTAYYYINNWAVTSGSNTSFSLHSPAYIQVSTIGDLSPGTYKVVYGGGSVNYIMGKKFLMQLFIAANNSGWWLADEYEITNPSAVDNVQCNFWVNSVANLPVRKTSIYVYNNTNLYVLLRMHPMNEQLNWDNELGPYYSTLATWEAAGSPTFGVTPGWNANPGVLSNIAGPDAHADGIPGQFNDYVRSHANLKTLNSCAGGLISDISIDVYKEE